MRIHTKTVFFFSSTRAPPMLLLTHLPRHDHLFQSGERNISWNHWKRLYQVCVIKKCIPYKAAVYLRCWTHKVANELVWSWKILEWDAYNCQHGRSGPIPLSYSKHRYHLVLLTIIGLWISISYMDLLCGILECSIQAVHCCFWYSKSLHSEGWLCVTN